MAPRSSTTSEVLMGRNEFIFVPGERDECINIILLLVGYFVNGCGDRSMCMHYFVGCKYVRELGGRLMGGLSSSRSNESGGSMVGRFRVGETDQTPFGCRRRCRYGKRRRQLEATAQTSGVGGTTTVGDGRQTAADGGDQRWRLASSLSSSLSTTAGGNYCFPCSGCRPVCRRPPLSSPPPFSPPFPLFFC